MVSDWCFWENCFSVEECDEIIKLASGREMIKPTIGDQFLSTKVDDNFRRGSICFIDQYDSSFGKYFDKLWKIQRRVNNDFFHLHVTDLPSVQFSEYDSQFKSEYKEHQDIFWINNSDKHRKVTLVLQLTDPSEYVGGELVLNSYGINPTEEEQVKMKQRGTIIAFTSFVPHALKPVVAGCRHSLVAWFEGPKFK